MQKIIKIGDKVPGQNFWRILLNKWFEIMDEYVKESKNDLPYWHSERANTGFLAAAAWKIDALAIEEYYTDRVYASGRYKGQCDLWIKYNNFEFSAEAKQLWRKEYDKKLVERKFEESKGQLISIPDREKEEKSFCICYLSLMSSSKSRPHDLNVIAKKIKDDFVKDEEIILALYAPDIAEEKIIWPPNKHRFPCIVLFIKSVKIEKLMNNQKQIEEWSKLYARQMTEEEYIEIRDNLAAYFELLHEAYMDEKNKNRK